MKNEKVLNTIEEAIEDFRQGKIVIVVDDEDRENEGDFIIAAEKVTPEIVNFMLKNGRGVLCAPLSEERCAQLELNMMEPNNTSLLGTPFTVTVDLLGEGCTTGVSIHDRAATLRALADPKTKPSDLGRPGHINPLRARQKGVLRRPGHTEAAVDLARLAGLQPAGALIEIMNEDGSMARLPQLLEVAEKYGLKIISIADLIAYRLRNESIVERGETAEMPGMYAGGEYDIAGFTCGVVEKSRLIDGTKVRVGDVLVGIASSGVHSNGFSLVRKVVADAGLDLRKAYPELDGRVLGEVLLTPTKIYVKQVLEVIRACNVHGISHITGGGFDENIPRILSEGQGIEIHEGTWEILPVFRLLEKYGKIAHREMFNIFNMGIGMVIAVSQDEASEVIAILEKQGEKASVIGRATDRPGVEIR